MSRDVDRRLARASQLLRRRMRLRQVDMRSPRHVVQAVEAGQVGRLTLDQIQRYFEEFDARARLTLWWNGADLDRLLDRRHAGIVEAGLYELRHYGWKTAGEVTFSEFGERGSIDLMAANEASASVFVGEAKSEWGSIEETLRRLDMKARLAPKIALQTFGFRPLLVAAVLLFAEDRTARRVAARFSTTLDSALPARGRDIRRWLREPAGNLRGLWFLTGAADDTHSRDRKPRIRRDR